MDLRVVKGKTFQNQRVIMRGSRYEDCTFILCHMVYDGEGLFSFDNCTFVECNWSFEGAAENTLEFLAALYVGLGYEGQQLVESVFASIRTGKVKDQMIPLLPH